MKEEFETYVYRNLIKSIPIWIALGILIPLSILLLVYLLN